MNNKKKCGIILGETISEICDNLLPCPLHSNPPQEKQECCEKCKSPEAAKMSGLLCLARTCLCHTKVELSKCCEAEKRFRAVTKKQYGNPNTPYCSKCGKPFSPQSPVSTVKGDKYCLIHMKNNCELEKPKKGDGIYKVTEVGRKQIVFTREPSVPDINNAKGECGEVNCTFKDGISGTHTHSPSPDSEAESEKYIPENKIFFAMLKSLRGTEERKGDGYDPITVYQEFEKLLSSNSKALLKEKVEEIRKMKKEIHIKEKVMIDLSFKELRDAGYNDAIDDIINLLDK